LPELKIVHHGKQAVVADALLGEDCVH
jgi:hypothetical protein